MPRVSELKHNIINGAFDEVFSRLYGDICAARARYAALCDSFIGSYGDPAGARLVSVPGRTEICGNHTDHNNGRVAAASVDIDIICVAAKSDDDTVRITSAGHRENVVMLPDTAPRCSEQDHSTAIVRGILAALSQNGYTTGGSRAATTSQVLRGSGLSSSAAFEVAVGKMVSVLYNGDGIDYITLAKAGQFAENVYYGKPSGLLDQTACAAGGFVALDFLDLNNPSVISMPLDLSKHDLSLCVLSTGGSHAGLTDDYASVPYEMKLIAKTLGKTVLRELGRAEVLENIAMLRDACGDRAVLRALHYFDENERVERLIDAVSRDDIKSFLSIVRESGRSSFMYNQNAYSPKYPEKQGLSLGYAVCESILKDEGAYRLQGGGFAGTMQAFVPNALLDRFVTESERVFGKGACKKLSIRQAGAVSLDSL